MFNRIPLREFWLPRVYSALLFSFSFLVQYPSLLLSLSLSLSSLTHIEPKIITSKSRLKKVKVGRKYWFPQFPNIISLIVHKLSDVKQYEGVYTYVELQGKMMFP